MEKQPTLSRALKSVNPFRVMTVMQRAKELASAGRDVIHMEVGEPDFTSAEPIIKAAKLALDEGRTQYTEAPGIQPLRAYIADMYASRYGVKIAPERVLITPGASAGLTLLAHLLVNSGDGILLSDPAYPCVRNFINLMSAHPQLVPVGPQDNFQPGVDKLEACRTENTTGVWLASPSNPAGTILTRSELHTICQWAREREMHVLVDEIYHGLHYVDDLPSALEIDNECFVVNSFSKYYGMTGWRLGWIVVPESNIESANILAQNLYISAPSIAQYAALAAFTPAAQEIFEERREAFRQRRDFLSQALSEIGFLLPDTIQGAFYIYADISKFSTDSEDFCRNMLEQHGIAITPGTDFGDYDASKFVRFAFTTSMENLVKAAERLSQALG